jgi:putative spermidine/putrescine transport system substrate-binding protein
MGRQTTIIIAAAAAIVILAGVLLFMLNNNSERDAEQMDRDLSAMPLPATTGDTGTPALPAGGPTGATSFKGQQLVVVSWGGAYTKSQVEAYHKPWEAKTGAKINSIDYSGGIAQLKAQVEAGNVDWDVIDMEIADAQRACDEGLLEKIDAGLLPPAPDGTPAVQDFVPNGITPCAVTSIVFGHIVAYDSTKFGASPPRTLADFFNLKAFPGKRGLRKTSPTVNLEMALRADGVPGDKVYTTLSTKEGVDRAFKKLDTIKNSVVWWEAGAQPVQLLADGEVTMTSAYNGRIFDAQANEKKPFVIIWDGELLELDVFGIAKGSKHLDMARDFVAFATDTQRLADQARWIAYGPARMSSLSLVGKSALNDVDMKPNMPNAPENAANAIQIDFQWWADHQEELNQRWNAWLAK